MRRLTRAHIIRKARHCTYDSFLVFRRKSGWIVNSVYPSVRPGTSSEERSRSDIDYVAGTIKCKIHGLKGARKKGTNPDRDDAVGCDGKSSVKRHRGGHCGGCRHRRQRRRRLGKVIIMADKRFSLEYNREIPF